MEIINTEKMKKYNEEFKLMTRKINDHERIDLFRVINGKDELLIGMLDSYKQGRDYLNNEYQVEYSEFKDFISVLVKVIEEKIWMFDFEPPQWKENWDACLRHLIFDYKGMKTTVEIDLKVTTGYNRYLTTEIEWLQVLHNEKLDSIVSRFIEEAFRVLDQLFTDELIT